MVIIGWAMLALVLAPAFLGSVCSLASPDRQDRRYGATGLGLIVFVVLMIALAR